MHVPSGYVGLLLDGARVIARPDAADAVRGALRGGTLYDFARTHARRVLHGRLPAYVVHLTATLSAVVRHNTHGGALARLTGDRFVAPTRAPHELALSDRLRAAGVRTPAVIAIARYPAGGRFERSDVATEEVPDASDLAHVLQEEPALHEQAAVATAALLRALRTAGARHADLNLKNVLLQRRNGGFEAWLLDVDRVTFHAPGSRLAAWRNWRRFRRSARKWRARRGVPISEQWLRQVAQLVSEHSG